MTKTYNLETNLGKRVVSFKMLFNLKLQGSGLQLSEVEEF